MRRYRRSLTLVQDILCIIGCEVCAGRYLLLGILRTGPLGGLELLLGLIWMTLGGVWITRMESRPPIRQ